ncbi:MAG: hypothetical protein NVS3B25_33350 [Hymenobacter sp.]
MTEKATDLPVALTKTAAMRYIAETVGHGYVLFQNGVVPAAKLPQLIEKFDREYRILGTRGMRDNDRLRGRSCTRLIVFPKVSYPVEKTEGEWLFWLLATEGDGPFPREMCTQDARNKVTRLRWEGQYELVSRPVRRRNGDLDYVWTWVLQEQFLERWKRVFSKAAGRVRSSKERKPAYLIKLVTALRHVPGFHGINRQKKALIVGADIPKSWHQELNLKYLGTVVNKVLPVFAVDRTIMVMLRAEPPERQKSSVRQNI